MDILLPRKGKQLYNTIFAPDSRLVESSDRRTEKMSTDFIELHAASLDG
jgi:hypothetical protein